MTTKLSDPVSELGVLLSGESLERLAIFRRETLGDDPGAHMGPGQLARVGQALTDIGNECIAISKSLVRPRIEGGVGSSAKTEDAGVMFSWRRGSESVRINTKKVREMFPQEDYPELYTVYASADSISASVADLG